MDNLENIDDLGEKRGPRPSFLTVLCILSFIAIGLSFSSGLTSLVTGPMNEDEMAEIDTKMVELVDELRSNEIEGMAQMIEKIGRMQVAVNEQHYAVNSTNVLFALIGLVGVILMWQGRKLGFHLYIIYCLLATVQLYFFVPSVDIPAIIVIVSLLLSGLFIFMYSRNLKWMQ